MDKLIEHTLCMLGVTRNYIGYHIFKKAVILAIEDETRLLNITKNIYLPLAVEYNCKLHCIERNIRTIIFVIWNKNREKLFEITKCDLKSPPTTSELIDIISSYVQDIYNKKII